VDLALVFSWLRLVGLASILLAVCLAPAPGAALTDPPAPAHSARLPKLLFGIGPEADRARRTEVAQRSPVRMLTSWYSGPKDLDWMSAWKTGEVPRAYASGYAMHLIVWTGDPEGRLSTRYGPACGRAYPLSSRFLDDMRKLARIFAGRAAGPPLYVTLFTELQTYPCRDNAWAPDAATVDYYRALKDQYRSAVAIFHRGARNSRISLGWGGWQARWDDPAIGGGRSIFRHFADVMRASDFQSFQAMSVKSNVADVLRMTGVLGRYGRVLLAHYKPDDGSQVTFNSDVTQMLTDGYLRKASRRGLFAFSFMDDKNLGDPGISQFVRKAIGRYGRRP
jgi:hypothetical protein